MSNMTREETINVLQSIEDRATDFPYMTACDWVAIAAAKRHLENSLEAEEADSYNNGWIDCAKQMPPEVKQYSDTLQGHREWTQSDLVLAWDSFYGCRIDATKNGKWMSEQRYGYTGQGLH
jgi:hypothetical protein